MQLYLIWRRPCRRGKLLAEKLGARLHGIEHKFASRYLRFADYIYKFFSTLCLLKRLKPEVVYIHAPPLFVALPALLLRVPYVLDTHNAVWQGVWGKLPFSRIFLKHADFIIVHNHEILEEAQRQYPCDKYVVMRDAIVPITRNSERKEKHVLFIASFNNGEPVDVIIETIKRLPDYTFYITANPRKLCEYQRKELEGCENLKLTGFLSVDDYETLLCSSQAAIVLEERPAIQPCGACEALSSDTPLILSRISLTENLFGAWAILVENQVDSIVEGVKKSEGMTLDLSEERDAWNRDVNEGVDKLSNYYDKTLNYENGGSGGSLGNDFDYD